ncbi:MAG: hypothetical protein IJ191_05470 [Treponema sp.]|nr:hypothetical protein [Treponema sp.]
MSVFVYNNTLCRFDTAFSCCGKQLRCIGKWLAAVDFDKKYELPQAMEVYGGQNQA